MRGRHRPLGRAAGAGLALALLAACGLQPVYSGGPHGAAAAMLGSVEVLPIADRAGFLVRNELLQRLPQSGSPRYRLQVVLDDDIVGFGVRGDNSIVRERRTLRARYRLIDAVADTVLIDATTSTDTGIDVTSSEYAVIAAEQSALERLSVEIADRIVSRIGVYGRNHPRPDS